MKKLLPPLFLLAVLAYFVADCFLLDRATVAFTRSASPRDTLVGLPEPRFFTDPDAYAWLCHTRDMLLAGDWRIRHTHMDNAPYGRPMHWSHLLIWELAAHARLLQRLHPDMLLSPALEIAGRCAMPFFFLLILPPLYFLCLRKLGFLPAAVFALSSVAFPFFSEIFTPLQPDHHVFQYLFPLVTVTALTFGGWGRVSTTSPSGNTPPSFWIRPLVLPSLSAARRWFLLAGAAHACLLWIGASVWLVVHCALCLAALAALAPPTPDSRPAPRLWRSFLSTSLPLSIVFYLLEYAPHFPGMRLEVNHPLYWLFLLGTVLALSRLDSSRNLLAPQTLRALIVPILLTLPLPLALLFGPASWHALHDPFLSRLHARYINEFLPYLSTLRAHPFHPFSAFRLFLVPFFAVPLLALWPRTSLSSGVRRTLRPHAILLLAFLTLTLYQQRWGTPLAAVLLSSSLVLLSLVPLSASSLPRRLAASFLVILALDAIWNVAATTIDLLRAAQNRYTPSHWISCDLRKRAALRLASTAAATPGGNSWVLAGFAPDAPVFYHFGGIPSLASFYWENAPGWHSEALLLSSPADAIPSSLLDGMRTRGLARVLVSPASDLPELYQFVATGSANPFATRKTLLGRLVHTPGTPPPPGFVPDSALSDLLSRTTLFSLPHKGSNTFAPEHLDWAAYALAPPP